MTRPALIIAQEWREAATALCGPVYDVYPYGTDADLSNRAVLLWVNGRDVTDEAQRIAALPRNDQQAVKRFLAGDLTPADFASYNDFLLTARERSKLVEPELDAGVAPQMNSEQQDQRAKYRSGDSTQQDAAEYPDNPCTEQNSGAQTHTRQDLILDASATDAPDQNAEAQALPSLSESDTQGGPFSTESPPDASAPHDMPPAFFTEDMSCYESPASHGGWPVPVPIDYRTSRAAPFDIDMAPASIQPFLADCGRRTGIDVGAYLIGALGAISGLCNDGFKLQPKLLDTRWRVHPSIWPIGVGDSSSGKTPGIEEAMRFVQALDLAEEKNNVRRRLDHQFQMESYDDAKRAARKSKGPRPEAPEPPQIKQYWMDKATPEGVENALVTSRKLIWYMDEWSGLINGIDRYASSGKGSGGREFVLSLYNGGPGKKTLVSGNSIIPNKSAVLCGGITPSAMMSAAGGALENDGLLQRTFICMVRTMVAGQDATPNAEAYERLESLLNTLAEGHGEACLLMSEGASEVYQAFTTRVLTLMQNEENAALTSHLGKWAGMAPRMMLIYHLADLAANGQHPRHGERIDKRTAERVCSLFLDWQLSHLKEFWYGLMGGVSSAPLIFAQSAARYILAHADWNNPAPEVSLVELYNGHYGKGGKWGVLKGWERKEAINILEYAGWWVPNGEGRNRDGIPRSFLVNPRIGSIMREEIDVEVKRRAAARAEIERVKAEAARRAG